MSPINGDHLDARGRYENPLPPENRGRHHIRRADRNDVRPRQYSGTTSPCRDARSDHSRGADAGYADDHARSATGRNSTCFSAAAPTSAGTACPKRPERELEHAEVCTRSFCVYLHGQPRYKKYDFYCLNREYRLLAYTRADFTDTYTLEKQQEQKLREALKAAQQADRAKSEFVSRISHDIRTPIGIISNIDDKMLGISRRHLRTELDLVVTAQQVRSYKPDDTHFKECARRIGGKKGWLHIASGYETDVAPLLKMKVPVIWVNRKGEKLAGRKKPSLEVKSFHDAVKKLGAGG